jgi:hypothetical protein
MQRVICNEKQANCRSVNGPVAQVRVASCEVVGE